jgi:hypothetical protein
VSASGVSASGEAPLGKIPVHGVAPSADSAPAAAHSTRDGPVRKSRSRASFQLQSAAPVSKPAGLPADPHDGGPHEDVKDMATYLRLDPQRDYRFMWVSQVRCYAFIQTPLIRPVTQTDLLVRSTISACDERTCPT